MLVALTFAVLISAPPSTDLDLSPIFGEDVVERAGGTDSSHYEKGRPALAAVALAHLEGPHAAYLRARALRDSGYLADALRALDGLEKSLPEIGDHILVMRGEILVLLGRTKEALEAYSAVDDSSIAKDRVRLAMARTFAGIGEPDQAVEVLAPLCARLAPDDRSRPDHAATALLLAGQILNHGPRPDPAKARADLLSCWSEHPLAPEADLCLASLRALPKAYRAPPGPDAELARAERFLEANRADAALAGLRRIHASPPQADNAFACRAAAALGRAYRREHDNAQAVALLSAVSEHCTDPALLPRVLFVLASSRATLGDHDAAVAGYRDMAATYPKSLLADDALLAAADILASDGRLAEAREALETLVRDHPGADTWNEARFRSAWLARREGDLAKALAAFSEIETTEAGVDPYEHARAAYWHARLLEGHDDPLDKAQSRALLEDLAARYPADYYGLLARSRLGEEKSPVELQVVQANFSIDLSFSPGALAADPHLKAGVLFLRLGLRQEAVEEFLAVDMAQASGTEPLLLLADLLDRAGDHRSASQILRTRARAALHHAPRPEDLRVWRIAYPPAFRDSVKRLAPSTGVPTDLVLALVREESALDPRALSPVGAVGLTQLMLPTARKLARQVGVRLPTRADLMRADLNLRLGSRYLGQLLRRFDGSLVLAIAAYNAGPTAVDRWLVDRGGEELDAFVEEIPFDETRGYVKRVLRSYAAYRLLYGTPDEPPAAVKLGAARARG